MPELRRSLEILEPISNQPPYSLLDRAIENDVLPFCTDHDLGVIVYSPLQSGLLSGRMTRERIKQMPDDDLRRGKPEFQEPELSRAFRLVKVLREIADDWGCFGRGGSC